MKFRRTTAKTVIAAEYLDSGNSSHQERHEASAWLNEKLDEWLANVAFGTEDQCDPRGDHRD